MRKIIEGPNQPKSNRVETRRSNQFGALLGGLLAIGGMRLESDQKAINTPSEEAASQKIIQDIQRETAHWTPKQIQEVRVLARAIEQGLRNQQAEKQAIDRVRRQLSLELIERFSDPDQWEAWIQRHLRFSTLTHEAREKKCEEFKDYSKKFSIKEHDEHLIVLLEEMPIFELQVEQGTSSSPRVRITAVGIYGGEMNMSGEPYVTFEPQEGEELDLNRVGNMLMDWAQMEAVMQNPDR